MLIPVTGQGSARLGSDWDEFRRTFIILEIAMIID